ncbi:MAG: radical SAM protein [Clostridia bacterium]|nr:radical SAM protein [Clostridia bacterium]
MHKNIPIFIPHLGCPHQCVFCNQRSISGCAEFDESGVDAEIRAALATLPAGAESEIAFFGGSFTGIDRGLMLRLLDTAQKYVDEGRVGAIRLSTRPDYIDEEILSILSRYAVKTVELGLQSMDDRVLAASGRGHTAEEARRACRLVVSHGFSLVGQMMVGLPESSEETERKTAEEIVSMGASAARIYPTVVFYDTPLCEMARRGDYRPLTDTEAAKRSAEVLSILEAGGVPCIRIGLCATENLASPEAVYAGPNHPALGEAVWNEYYYTRIRKAVTEAGLTGREIALSVPHGEVSKVIGQRRCNAERLQRETGTRIKKVYDSLPHGEVRAQAWK